MDFSNVKAITIPEGDVTKITANRVVLWEQPSSYKNWVKYSTESDGVTIYNGGLGYKNGYRVRSGGAETGHTVASCTGYIPVKGGDTIRLSGYNALYVEAANAINVFDSSFTNLGQIAANAGYGYGEFENTWSSYNWNTVVEETSGVYKWVLPSDSRIAYIRVTGRTEGDGSTMIVTVNEEII